MAVFVAMACGACVLHWFASRTVLRGGPALPPQLFWGILGLAPRRCAWS